MASEPLSGAPSTLETENMSEDWRKMLRGQLYHAFIPEFIQARARCSKACHKFNTTDDVSRRRKVELWRDIVQDGRPMPPSAPTQDQDDALFENDPWIEPPIRIDYGTQLRLGNGSFINFNCTVLDTCLISIGARVLIGPNVSLFSGTHPLDPALRNGTQGPEMGAEVHIGDDCWIGGNVIILPGVTVGRGAVIGAGSVVTKSVPEFGVVAGNPARLLRKVDNTLDRGQEEGGKRKRGDDVRGAEEPMRLDAEKHGGPAVDDRSARVPRTEEVVEDVDAVVHDV